MPEPKRMFNGEMDQMFNDIDFSEDDIKKCFNKLKPNKAPGNDNIYPLVVKELVNELALPLSLLFKQSFNETCVPIEWREANVTPLYKKGKKKA